MREICFRCWDRDDKKMYCTDSIHWLGGEIDKVRREEHQGISDEGIFFKKLLPIKNYELMQYTGLKDKNGKDIYEGDIILVPNATEPEDKGWIVEWDSYGFVARCVRNINNDIYKTPFDNYFVRSEIIGNIHENS